MENNIPNEVRDFFRDNSIAWREKLVEVTTYEQLGTNVEFLNKEEARELLGTAVSFVSETLNQINIYQKAIEKLRDNPESTVDEWLNSVGFPMEHNLLSQALINKIGQLFQNVIHVIQNFIRRIVAVLRMSLEEVSFTFSVSPSVTLKFK